MDYHVKVECTDGYRNEFIRNADTAADAEARAVHNAQHIAHDDTVTGTAKATPLN